MNLPQEVRYRAYADWSTDEIAKINDNVKQSLGMPAIILSPKLGC